MAQQNFYSNPAFCQQSEFYNRRSPGKGLSPPRSQNSVRQPPVGALSPICVVDSSLPPRPGPKPPKFTSNNEDYQEQDFYEEMLVDDSGFVKQKKIVVVHSSNDNRNGNPTRYACVPRNDNQQQPRKPPEQQDRYAVIDEGMVRNNCKKGRYEYIQMQDPNHNQSTENCEQGYELGNRRIHRYAVIPVEEETELTNQGRYEICNDNSLPNHRYVKPNLNRRYEYIDSIEDEHYEQPHENPQLRRISSPLPSRRRPNPYATQKLHELLATPPKKFQPLYSRTPQKSTPRKPISDPFVTPKKSTPKKTPKAQQKLNYTLSTRQMGQEKRNTAIVAPICSSPVQSVYSETTFSNKSESWMNVSGSKQPVHATLTVAAVMMLLCGGLTSCLCFYMISIMGRLYFLDFGIVSGFACLVLGFLGCRSRNHYYWLPNRNYMSGYIILTLFSLLTCAGLLVLLFMQPKPGSPLADMTSGAVCGISVLSLILATAGVMTSYCCKLPPPDNRVEHCARGFTV